jgi:hypothetical protein
LAIAGFEAMLFMKAIAFIEVESDRLTDFDKTLSYTPKASGLMGAGEIQSQTGRV